MAMYQLHLVGFIDFLGFREALRQGGRGAQILELLTDISDQRRNYADESQPVFDDTGKTEIGMRVKVMPAVSAFSDNIMISCRLDQVSEGVDLSSALHFQKRLIGNIAWKAFNAGLLIRGGLAVGDAYHQDGVVFGPAVVEAYETERHLAIYPRIALGPSMIQTVTDPRLPKRFSVDHDGIATLDYLWDFILRTNARSGQADVIVKSWIEEVRAKINQNVALLSGAKQLRALAKWKWFEAKLNTAIETFPPSLLKNNPAESD